MASGRPACTIDTGNRSRSPELEEKRERKEAGGRERPPAGRIADYFAAFIGCGTLFAPRLRNTLIEPG